MQPRDEIRKAYDMASEVYAQKFLQELDHKPFDRDLLASFAQQLGAGARVLDLGCGPGQTTAFVHGLGLDVTGVDLSPRMVERALQQFPNIPFVQGDFFELDFPAESVGGVLAFYAIVHLTVDELLPAFTEMHRVLSPRGTLFLSFHVGTEVVHTDSFLDTGAVLDFTAFQPQDVANALTEAGYCDLEIAQRPPYETEYPSERCYIFARKPTATG